MFRQERYKALCEQAIRGVAERHGITVVELNVQPDHVHCVVLLPWTMLPCTAAGLLKGGSAFVLFRAEPRFRLRYPRGHFWSTGLFCRTVGSADLSTVVGYVRNQDNHHAQQGDLKQWLP